MGESKGLRRLVLIAAISLSPGVMFGQEQALTEDSLAVDSVMPTPKVYKGQITVKHFKELWTAAEVNTAVELPSEQAYRGELEDVSDNRLEYYWYKMSQ